MHQYYFEYYFDGASEKLSRKQHTFWLGANVGGAKAVLLISELFLSNSRPIFQTDTSLENNLKIRCIKVIGFFFPAKRYKPTEVFWATWWGVNNKRGRSEVYNVGKRSYRWGPQWSAGRPLSLMTTRQCKSTKIFGKPGVSHLSLY